MSSSGTEPCAASLARRTELGKLFSGLRRVRSRTPFFRLAAHRIPTLWGLYRGLMKEAPTCEIRWRMRKLFEKHRGETSTEKTKVMLNRGYKYLDAFKRAREGETKLRGILERYSSMIAAKRDKENWKQVLRKEFAWHHRLSTKPILTGSLIRPTLDNKSIPRLHPQPDHIDPMIRARRNAREKRFARFTTLQDVKADLHAEAAFEEKLLGEKGVVFSGKAKNEWMKPIWRELDEMKAAHERALERLNTPVPPEMYRVLVAARRFKIANKTRQKENERRGVYTPATYRRMRRQPPTWVLEKMDERKKEVERTVRAPGEGGYVGRVKRAQGVRMRGGEGWRREAEVGGEGVERERAVFKEAERRARVAIDGEV